MATKHAIYLESLVKLAKQKPESTEALKCIAKCYILNEGIADNIKSLYNKAKTALTTDPVSNPVPVTPKKTPEDEKLIQLDKETYKNDYEYFKMYVNELLMYMNSYGDAALIEFLMSPERLGLDRSQVLAWYTLYQAGMMALVLVFLWLPVRRKTSPVRIPYRLRDEILCSGRVYVRFSGSVGHRPHLEAAYRDGTHQGLDGELQGRH